MEKKNTRDQILLVALDLFSKRGYEATSIAQIADAIGIRKASLYSHFASKQDILDCLMKDIMEEYNKHSIFSNSNWEDDDFTAKMENLDCEEVARMVKGQIKYIINDPVVSKVRKLLTIEQFQNPELKEMQSRQSYEDIYKYNLGLMKFLIKKGELRDEDPEIMAAQFCWPISMWTMLCDREPEREEEAMALMDRHIEQFFKLYRK